MSQSASLDLSAIKEWVLAKLEPHAVEEKLRERGLDPESIIAHIREYKRQCNAKKQFNGFLLLGIGGFLGFFSCVLSVINPIPELYNLILYGFTSVSLILIFAGLYCVFE